MRGACWCWEMCMIKEEGERRISGVNIFGMGSDHIPQISLSAWLMGTQGSLPSLTSPYILHACFPTFLKEASPTLFVKCLQKKDPSFSYRGCSCIYLIPFNSFKTFSTRTCNAFSFGDKPEFALYSKMCCGINTLHTWCVFPECNGCDSAGRQHTDIAGMDYSTCPDRFVRGTPGLGCVSPHWPTRQLTLIILSANGRFNLLPHGVL